MGWGLPGVLRLLPQPTIVVVDRVRETLASLPTTALICDVGAGGRRLREGVVTVDAVPVPGVDVVGDIHSLPFADSSIDAVFCTGTLEHVIDPKAAVGEFKRVLKAGGLVHIDVPFIQGY